jgi:hypothetical protein
MKEINSCEHGDGCACILNEEARESDVVRAGGGF